MEVIKVQKIKDGEVVEVSYARVSTEQESQATSFSSQMSHYRELFEKKGSKVGNCGALYQDKVLTLTNNGIYADEGISGAKAYKNREAFMRMIDDAKLGLFNKIYCKNIYRFSRDVEAGSKFIKDLRVLGVEVYFEDGGLSTLDASSDLVINMLLSVGQEESRSKSAAIQWGVRRQQEKGKYHALPSYGYNIDEEGYLQINQEEVSTICDIFNMYLEDGFGLSKIATELINKNIKTKKGGQWSSQHIKVILKNEIYIGKQITNKQNVNAMAYFIKEKVAEENQIVHYFEHLRIIDDDTFRRTQEEMKNRAGIGTFYNPKDYNTSTKHVFSNLIKCGNCGGGHGRKIRRTHSRISGESNYLGHEWICKNNDNYGKGRCAYRNQIVEDDLLEEAKEQLRNWKNDSTPILRTKGLYLDLYYNAQAKLKEKDEYEEQLAKLTKQVQLNFELLGDLIIDKEEYRTRNNNLQSDIKAIKEQMRGISGIDKEIARVERDYQLYIKTLNSIDIDNLTNVKLKKMINKVIVETDENGEKSHYIDWKFLNSNLSDISNDLTFKAMEEDHFDKIPPEFRNRKFRI